MGRLKIFGAADSISAAGCANDPMTKSPPIDPGPWLTPEQVIERLTADPALRRRASTCVLPAVRRGDTWQFRKSDLDEWIGRQDSASGDNEAG